MATPILSAFYFGSVEHYAVLASHPKVIIDLGEHFVRQTYRTRTSILGPNGRQDLIARIDRRSESIAGLAHRKGEKIPMRSVGLSYSESWPQQHIHAIRSAYGQAPWFIHFIDEIEDLLTKRYDRLVDLDLATMRAGIRWTGLSTELILEEEYVDAGPGSITGELDLRTTLHPKKPLPSAVPQVKPYPQVFAYRHGPVARLSVIDLVMNKGPEAPGIVRGIA